MQSRRNRCKNSEHELGKLEAADLFTSLSMLYLKGVPLTLCQKGGMLAVLVYPVLWNGSGPKPSMGGSSQKMQEIVAVLKEWSTKSNTKSSPDFVLVRTLSRYHESFELESMDPDERKVVQLLLDACKESASQVYLASAMRTTEERVHFGYSGGYGYGRESCGMEEELDCSYKILDIQGKDLLDAHPDAEVDNVMHTLLGDDWDDDAESDSDDGEGWNRKSYKRSAIIVLPDSHLSKFKRNHLGATESQDEQSPVPAEADKAASAQQRTMKELANANSRAFRSSVATANRQNSGHEQPHNKKRKLDDSKENNPSKRRQPPLSIAELV